MKLLRPFTNLVAALRILSSWYISFLRYGQFAWMAYSRCGRTKALYRGTKISFVRQVNDLFMKYNIPLPLLVTVRTLDEGVTAKFTLMPRSLIWSHFCYDLPSASSDKVIRRSGVPPIDRWWPLLAYNGRSHRICSFMWY